MRSSLTALYMFNFKDPIHPLYGLLIFLTTEQQHNGMVINTFNKHNFSKIYYIRLPLLYVHRGELKFL